MEREILVVEDDPTLVGAIGRNLVARGYAPHCAQTLADALAALRDGAPALVLLDIDLPDGPGWEVVRTLHASGHTGVPIVVMSALRPNPRLCAELGAVAVLEKPFPMEALLRQVAALLRPPAAESAGEGWRDA